MSIVKGWDGGEQVRPTPKGKELEHRLCAREVCGLPIPSYKRSDAKYHDEKCRKLDAHQRNLDIRQLHKYGTIEPIPRDCFHCGEMYTPKRKGTWKSIYCGHNCNAATYRLRKQEPKPDAPTKPEARGCLVPQCTFFERVIFQKTQDGYWYWSRYGVCNTHQQRKSKLGSYTARRCHKCHLVFDNEGTAKLGRGRWYCEVCHNQTRDVLRHAGKTPTQ